MTDDTLLPFDLPAVSRKKVTADFAGGSISSDGGLVLLRGAERRLGLAETLAGCIREWRDPDRVVHSLPAMLRFRMFAIACGYEDADDCDELRADPLFKLAVGRAPESGRDLCSQPTMSRLENAPSSSEVGRMTAALVDIFCRSFPSPPAAIVLDIDETCDAVHGHQQLSLFNAFYDTRCFLPVHVYHVESGRPVAVLLRPGKTPSGVEVRTMLKHLTRRIRRHWPRTRLTFRGDSHYGRTEAMAWCEDNGVDYIFGLAGNAVLHALAGETGEKVRARHAEAGGDKVRGFADFAYAAGSWNRARRVVARLEATTRGFDARYIVTSLTGDPRANGGSLFRIYRDTRFSKNKTPYKTNVGAHFRHAAGRDAHAPGFYLHLEPEACFAGCGVWHPDGPTLAGIRDAIVERADEWRRITTAADFTGTFELTGDSLKRPPRGYDPDHPLIDDLKRKSFVAVTRFSETEACEADFPERFAGIARTGAGFVAFLAAAVGVAF